MEDRLVSFGESDPKMRDAIEEAQRTLRSFFDAFASPKPNQKSFLLKVVFKSGEKSEHIWMADINASVFPLEGTVANETEFPGLKFMERTAFHPSQVTDWMYVEDGYLVGGFTTRVIRDSMTPADRAESDSNRPYKIRD